MKRLLCCTMMGVIASLLLCPMTFAQDNFYYEPLLDDAYTTDKLETSQKISSQSTLPIGLALGVSVPDGVTAQCAVRIIPQLAVRAGIGFFQLDASQPSIVH